MTDINTNEVVDFADTGTVTARLDAAQRIKDMRMRPNTETEADDNIVDSRPFVDWDLVSDAISDLEDWAQSSSDLRSRLSAQALRMLVDALDDEVSAAELISRTLWSIVRLAATMNGNLSTPLGDIWRVTVGTMLDSQDLEEFMVKVRDYEAECAFERMYPAS